MRRATRCEQGAGRRPARGAPGPRIARRAPAAHLRAIYRAAVAAVDAQRLTGAVVSRYDDTLRIRLGRTSVLQPVGRLWVAGAGKAAVAMARAVASAAPRVRGVVIAPRGSAGRAGARAVRGLGKIAVLFGEHPVPGPGSFSATRRLVAELGRCPPDATVLVLLSGGASALLAMPAAGISPADKVRLNRWLLRSGLPVGEMNAVRKHVSAVKGGGLLRLAAPRTVLTLVLSDVLGDDLATIGSGPTVGDPTCFGDALAALDRGAAPRDVPAAVRRRIERGCAAAVPARARAAVPAGRTPTDPTGGIPGCERPALGDVGRQAPRETLEPGDALLRHSRTAIIGSNRDAVRGAAGRARALGYAVRVLDTPLAGEATFCAASFARRLPRRPRRPTCLLAGGETVVTAGKATGRGGRCQELALALAAHLAGTAWRVLAAATDGVDGATPAAGAMCDGATLARAGATEVARALAEHDSYGFFSRHGGLLRTGPSGTNALDVVVALHPGAPPNETQRRHGRAKGGRRAPRGPEAAGGSHGGKGGKRGR